MSINLFQKLEEALAAKRERRAKETITAEAAKSASKASDAEKEASKARQRAALIAAAVRLEEKLTAINARLAAL